MKPMSLLAILVAIVASFSPVAAEPLSTGFTYQGELNENGNPLTGTADFQFSLFDALSGGVQSGSTVAVNNVTVTDGIFATFLDFGVDVFNGDNRWLEIDVRSPAGVGAFTTLSPRVQVSATPYALQTRGIFVDTQGGVMVGDGVGSQPNRAAGAFVQFEANTASSNAIGVLGEATATSGPADGVTGRSASDVGRGVVGEATAATGTPVGVHGTAVVGEGVRGEGPTGASGVSDATDGKGLFGEATGSGTTIGVHGKATMGEGVRGEGPLGVCGDSDDVDGTGVLGQATGTGDTIGVQGTATSPTGEGVRGVAATGLCGVSTSPTDGIGVLGESSTGGATNRGVYGKSTALSGEGVCGEAAAGIGVRGLGEVGGHMEGDVSGVEGKCDTSAPDGTGVRAEGGGVDGPGIIRSAALTLYDGHFRVDGANRPAGTVPVGASAGSTILDNNGDVIGRYLEVTIFNDLITFDAMVLVSFQVGPSVLIVSACTETITTEGEIKVRLTKHGGTGGSTIDGDLHYLIIHGGSET